MNKENKGGFYPNKLLCKKTGDYCFGILCAVDRSIFSKIQNVESYRYHFLWKGALIDGTVIKNNNLTKPEHSGWYLNKIW